MKSKDSTYIPGMFFWAALLLLLQSGCTSMIVNPMLDPLTLSMQKQTNLELLRDGAPSLLLLLDGFIAGAPDNDRLLMTATRAYGAYATILAEDGKTEQAVDMSLKARDHGISLIRQLPGLKNINTMTLAEIQKTLGGIKPEKADSLFWGAYGWATWIQYQEGAPAAMAALPIVESMMLRVVELDESYYYGSAHIFLGSYYGSRPQMFGGRPELSRKHFERALEINDRQFLPTQVSYARTYALTAFDRDLFIKLLSEVIARPQSDSDIAASNKLAKVTAAKLIARADEFF